MLASTYTATHHGHPECTPPTREKWTPRSRTQLDSVHSIYTPGAIGEILALHVRLAYISVQPPDFSRCLTRLREVRFLLSVLRSSILSRIVLCLQELKATCDRKQRIEIIRLGTKDIKDTKILYLRK